MTKDQAIETCAKALVKRHGFSEERWKDQSKQKDLAEDIVIALEALGLFKPTLAHETVPTGGGPGGQLLGPPMRGGVWTGGRGGVVTASFAQSHDTPRFGEFQSKFPPFHNDRRRPKVPQPPGWDGRRRRCASA